MSNANKLGLIFQSGLTHLDFRLKPTHVDFWPKSNQLNLRP